MSLHFVCLFVCLGVCVSLLVVLYMEHFCLFMHAHVKLEYYVDLNYCPQYAKFSTKPRMFMLIILIGVDIRSYTNSCITLQNMHV